MRARRGARRGARRRARGARRGARRMNAWLTSFSNCCGRRLYHEQSSRGVGSDEDRPDSVQQLRRGAVRDGDRGEARRDPRGGVRSRLRGVREDGPQELRGEAEALPGGARAGASGDARPLMLRRRVAEGWAEKMELELSSRKLVSSLPRQRPKRSASKESVLKAE